MTEAKAILKARKEELEREIRALKESERKAAKSIVFYNNKIKCTEELLKEVIDAYKTLSLMIEKEK